MEYLPGGSLADRLEARAHNRVGRVLEWLGQAAAALDAAHSNGIVHRDVKPANLLLDDDERVKVADFGVASAADLGPFTEAGTVVGTAGYLAPEQARGERATPASDLYALAVVAFELLTGKRPFERESLDGGSDGARERADPAGVGLAIHSCRGSSTTSSLGASRRSPSIGSRTAADFVDALRDALDREAGTTRVAAIAPVAPRAQPAAACRCSCCSSAPLSSRASSPQRSSPGATAKRPARRRRRRPHDVHRRSETVRDRHASGHDGRPDRHDRPRRRRRDHGRGRPGLGKPVASSTTRASS